MSIRGTKPKSVHLKLVAGNPGRRPLQKQRGGLIPGGPAERPRKMNKGAADVWDRFIAKAQWLAWPDSAKAFIFCNLMAEYERGPGKMIASRIAQLRALGTELGLDLASRDRLGITVPSGADAVSDAPPQNPTNKYFT